MSDGSDSSPRRPPLRWTRAVAKATKKTPPTIATTTPAKPNTGDGPNASHSPIQSPMESLVQTDQRRQIAVNVPPARNASSAFDAIHERAAGGFFPGRVE